MASSIGAMNQLVADINNGIFAKCYLMCGKEAYLRILYKNKLLKALVPEGDTLNFNKYTGDDVTAGEIIDQAETMPFLAERRVVLIENCSLGKSGIEQLINYLPDMPDTTILILVDSDIDSKNKAYKAFEKEGKVYEFGVQSEHDLRAWIINKLKFEKKTTEKPVVDMIIERTGTDMLAIDSEMEKLLSYTADKTFITVADVEAITTVSVNNKVFDMIDSMVNRKADEAIKRYHDIIVQRESNPIGVLKLIVRQYNIMLQIKELRANGIPSTRIPDMIKQPSFVCRKCEAQIRNYSIERIREVLESCAKVEEDVMIRSMNPEFMVELLIIEYSR